jgi:hypothetical protein
VETQPGLCAIVDIVCSPRPGLRRPKGMLLATFRALFRILIGRRDGRYSA